ncbi:hypothetical protein ACFL4W_01820 [Planctomycetota bacterium]
MKKLVVLLAITLVFGTVIGCGGTSVRKIDEPTKPSQKLTGHEGEPDWVARGGGIFEGEHGRAIYAIGTARSAPSYHIMMKKSQQRAREELSTILSVHIKSMTKDFTETAADLYDAETESAVEYFSSVSVGITNNVLIGSEKVDAWRHPDNGEMFVLMKVSLDKLMDVFKNETKQALKRKKTREALGIKTDDAIKQMEGMIDKSVKEYTNQQAEATAKP